MAIDTRDRRASSFAPVLSFLRIWPLAGAPDTYHRRRHCTYVYRGIIASSIGGSVVKAVVYVPGSALALSYTPGAVLVEVNS